MSSPDDMQEFGESKVGQPRDNFDGVPEHDNCNDCGMMLATLKERQAGVCFGCQWKQEQGDH